MKNLCETSNARLVICEKDIIFSFSLHISLITNLAPPTKIHLSQVGNFIFLLF
eukprot:UN01675